MSAAVLDNVSSKKRQLLEILLQEKRRNKQVADLQEPIPRRPSEAPRVLSYSQRRLWFIEQLQPGSAAYHVPGAVRIRGPLNLAVLRAAVDAIGERHETLRFALAEERGLPVPRVVEHRCLHLDEVDLRPMLRERPATAIREAIDQQMRQPFDLSTPPLARTTLLRVAEDEWIFLLLMHHVIADVWSIGVFFRSVIQLYDAWTAPGATPGETSSLDQLPLQYSDYAHWQARQLEGANLERLLSFWREQLADAPKTLELPIDLPRPAEQTFRGGQSYMQLDQELVGGLRALAQGEGASLYMVLMAAFDTLLFRYTGQRTILAGIPIANRNRLELEGLIGLLLNTLVMRADPETGKSYRELLAEVRQRVLDGFAHQELPFERLVEELKIERDMSRNPVYQVMFTFQNVPTTPMKARGLQLSRHEVLEGTSREDLELNLRETDDGVAGWFAYDVGLFEATTVARFAGHFQRLLHGIVEDPERRLGELPLMGPVEVHQLLHEWDDSEQAGLPCQSFQELFAARVAEHPEAPAATCDGETLSYAALNERASRLAAALMERGVGRDDRIALLGDRGLDFLTAILAVFQAGGAYLPLDPNHPPRRLAQVLERSGARLLLAAAEFADPATAALERVAAAQRPTLETWDTLLDHPRRAVPRAGARGDLAYVLFTSGSTGLPKGAMIEQGGMLNHLAAKILELRLGPSDRIAQNASQCFDISVWQFLAALAVGGEVVIYSDAIAHEPARLLDRVAEDRITILETVPSVLRWILEEAARRGDQRSALPALRFLVPTGEALPPSLCERWLGLYPHVPLVNAYGPTECSDDVAHHALDRPLPLERARVPIGRAVINTQLYGVDERLRPVPVGVAGELCVGGLGVGRGYVGDPGRTAEVFVPDPFATLPGARLYRTGDEARRLADGSLDFLGRIDFQVKVRGFRIELGEIEALLSRHATVREVAVTAPQTDRGDRTLVAYLVPAPGAEIADKVLAEYLRQRLPDYMVPASFVALDALPLTANGKIDRRALESRGVDFVSEAVYVAPRNPVEEGLAEIWAEVLRRDAVGAQDHFFEVGGQSLLATQITSRIRERFAVEVPVRTLFQHPVLEDLARAVEVAMLSDHGMPEAPPMESIPRTGGLPLSFAQERLWFIDQLRPGLTVYNIFGAVRMRGHLDVRVLERSFSELTRRHEVLRTTFATEGGRPVQLVGEPWAVPIRMIDLRALAAADRSPLAQALGNAEAQRPFALSTGPLIRGVLLREEDDNYLLAVTAHHIVYDVWSREILIRELAALYEGFHEDRPSPLSELPVQYADFAQWQRRWLQGEVLDTQLRYWGERLAGVQGGTELSPDRPRPPVQSFRGARTLTRLDRELTAALHGLSRQHGVTVFMTLLAGFKTLLHRMTLEEDIVVGSPIANRNRAEIEAMIGFFVNTQVLRTDLSGAPTFGEILGRVRDMALGAYAHQDFAFEQLVKELKPRRDTARQPLFQVLFNFLTNYQPIRMELPGPVHLTPEANHSGAVQFDLVMSMYEIDGELYGSADYATDLFDRTTIDRLLGHFTQLLASAAVDSGQALGDLPLWSPAQRHQLRVEWNDTGGVRSDLVLESFAAQVAARPEATAVVAVEDGTRQLTYRQLDAQARRIAARLRHLEVGPGSVVGVLGGRSPETVAAIWGVLRAGAAYLPLDPDYPDDRLAFMVEDSGAALLLVEAPHAARLTAPDVRALHLGFGEADGEVDGSIGGEAEGDIAPLPRPRAEHPAYLIYTSGSTGRPKGVVVRHGNLAHSTAARLAYYRGAPEAFLLLSSLAFDSSVAGLFGTLCGGGRLVLAPSNLKDDVSRLTTVIEAQGVTHLLCVPSVYSVLLEQPPAPTLRAVIVAGEECLPELVARHRQTRPGTQLFNEYGPTEATVWSSVGQLAAMEGAARVADAAAMPVPPVTIGRPIAGARLHLLDRGGRPVPVGCPGEIHIGGPGVTLGYVGQPRATAVAFVPDPFTAPPGEPRGGRLYRTGDLARQTASGEFLFLGRIDRQVKVRGYRIELGEVESVLQTHSAVREAAVVVVGGATGGPQAHRLVACLVLAEGLEQPEPQVLRAHLRERLPEVMVPSAFVVLEALPLTPNGKVDRRALATTAGDEAAVREVPYVAPRTDTEATLVRLWSDLLGVQQVGVEDNFFDLGGHSLLTTQLVSRLRDTFDLEVPLQSFFEEPTVAGLAESIDLARWAAERVEERPVAIAAGVGEEDDLETGEI